MMSVIDKIRATALCEANQEIERLKAIIAEREWQPPRRGAASGLSGGRWNVKNDVNNIPDSELLGRAVRSFVTSTARNSKPRYLAVSQVFCLGSTYSRQLCVRFGMDPDGAVMP
jgi:hypothetical protein